MNLTPAFGFQPGSDEPTGASVPAGPSREGGPVFVPANTPHALLVLRVNFRSIRKGGEHFSPNPILKFPTPIPTFTKEGLGPKGKEPLKLYPTVL